MITKAPSLLKRLIKILGFYSESDGRIKHNKRMIKYTLKSMECLARGDIQKSASILETIAEHEEAYKRDPENV